MVKTKTESNLGTDKLWKLILRFSVPCTVCLVVNALYNIVDQIFIGQSVGYIGNTATNVIYPLTVAITAVAALIGDGCAALFSLMLGRGDKEKASHAVCSTLILSAIVGVVLAIISFALLKPLCYLFGATEESLPYALDYGYIIVIGFPFLVIDYVYSAIVRADGSPRFSMIGLLIGCATNLVLDPIFISVCGWGVKGAAIATILGQIFNAVFLFIYLGRFKNITMQKQNFKPRLPILGKMLSLGLSSFIMQFSIAIIVTVCNNLLVKFGAQSVYGSDIPMATMGITMKVNLIVINIIQGIATGSQPILGYNYGAGNYERTKKTFIILAANCSVVSIIAFIIFQTCPMAIISLFGSESDLYNEFAVECLQIYLMLCLLNGFQNCVGFFFQAVGKPVLSAVNTMVKQVIIILPSMIIFAFAFGVEGILWAGPLTDAVAFITSIVLISVSWKKIFPKEKDKSKVNVAETV
ncbi:MAG: MATE family efflux transporter [Clostridia bacterium]|nr:MATE family efflux transporter [Clostridia bacterium]